MAKIVVIYVGCGMIWALAAHLVLRQVVDDPGKIHRLGILLGMLFVLLTASLLSLLLLRYNRKLAQSVAAVRASEARLNFLVQNASDSLVILDAAGRQRYVSPAASRITGYDVAELVGTTIDEVIHPEDLPRIHTAWQETVAQPERVVSAQYRHRHREHGWVHVEAVAQSFLEHPAIEGVIVSVRDITERKANEDRLERQDALLKAMFRNLPFDFWARDASQRLIMQSDQSIELWGEQGQAGLAGAFGKLRQQENLRALAGEVVAANHTVDLPDGRQREFNSIVAPIRSGQEILGTLAVNIDITGQQQALRELQAANELLSQFIRHSPIYAFIKAVTPGQSRVLYASENYCDMIGIAGSQMAGKTMEELFPPEFAHKITEDDWQVVSQGQVLRLDEELAGRHFTTIKFPLVIDGRHLLAGYTIDISERIRTEAELRRRENELREILEILPIGLWFADRHGALVRANRMGMAIWGVESKEGFAELEAFKAWRLPDRTPVRPEDLALAKTIRHGETVVDELLEIEAFDGQRKTILNYSTPLVDDHGEIEGAIMVNLDVSDRRALEDQLQQAQKMESIGRLAGGVAHDFNNMLSVILGRAELVLDGMEASAPEFASLGIIREAAQRSANLTQQLLGFARKQTIAPRIIDFNATTAGMLNMVQRLIGEHIAIDWQPGHGVGQVNMDPSQIDQILVNLCINARDAMHEKGKIDIVTGTHTVDTAVVSGRAEVQPGPYVFLAVRDNGRGMDAETLKHLFEPYFTTKEIGRGTGLGLATVYGIVQQNHGFIEVQSAPGEGTAVTVYFPRHATRVETDGQHDTAAAAAEGGRETILLVEDEPMVLELTKAILTAQGYTVLTAISPGEALCLANGYEGTIHMLMTDVIMPEMNGKDLAQRLHHGYPHMRRLFMSGYTADVIADHGVLDEGVHFIQKPFLPKDLATLVRQILDEAPTSDGVAAAS